MTFVLSVIGQDTLWTVADRRISYDKRREPKDDAVKVMRLETTDGLGLLAYAGLGDTGNGTQPSEWMSAVLRGRGDMTFEQSLDVLADAASRELPKHLTSLRDDRDDDGHVILVSAFVQGIARLYSIKIVINRKTGQHWCDYTNYQQADVPGSPSTRLGLAGSGGRYFARKDRKVGEWRRELLSLVDAHDHGKVSDLAVADRLAELNYEAHTKLEAKGDSTVGPRSIVAWCRRPGARRAASGGGQQFYTGVDRDPLSGPIPSISHGMDVEAVVKVYWDEAQRHMADPGFPLDMPDLDTDEINRQLAEIPTDPDEELR